ncbi:response regulator transcription factor [Actibacterium ureilyticum]|uniref:response regulator transcription factor n=1 Tax=Actibacterium ureilyticum TaxID=1590614 RepID=UPI000BAAFA2B|nr:response regulator transcription factor [Actibacterium ureilyticum]
MQVLILDDYPVFQSALANQLRAAGYDVTCAFAVDEALAHLRLGQTRLLILRDRIDGRGSLSAALAAEFYRPDVACVILSDRAGAETDELFDLIPALRALVGEDCRPALAAKCAMAACPMPVRPEMPVFVSRRRVGAGVPA